MMNETDETVIPLAHPPNRWLAVAVTLTAGLVAFFASSQSGGDRSGINHILGQFVGGVFLAVAAWLVVTAPFKPVVFASRRRLRRAWVLGLIRIPLRTILLQKAVGLVLEDISNPPDKPRILADQSTYERRRVTVIPHQRVYVRLRGAVGETSQVLLCRLYDKQAAPEIIAALCKASGLSLLKQ